LPLEADEKIQAVISIKDLTQDGYLVMGTKLGLVKKTTLVQFSSIRKNGLRAISLNEDDELIKVKLTRGDADIIVVTKEGYSIKFNETDIRAMGRTAAGVKALTLRGDDIAICMDIAVKEEELLIVSENGFGKRTSVTEYTAQRRGGKGLITYKTSDKTGKIAGATVVKDTDELMILNNYGVAIRILVSNVSVTGRNTMGVKLMRTGEDENVVAIAKINANEEIDDLVDNKFLTNEELVELQDTDEEEEEILDAEEVEDNDTDTEE